MTPHWQTLELGKSPRAYPFAIYANKNLNKDSLGKIKRIIVIVHGVQRDADRYYETVVFEPYPLTFGGVTLWNMVYFKGKPLSRDQ